MSLSPNDMLHEHLATSFAVESTPNLVHPNLVERNISESSELLASLLIHIETCQDLFAKEIQLTQEINRIQRELELDLTARVKFHKNRLAVVDAEISMASNLSKNSKAAYDKYAELAKRGSGDVKLSRQASRADSFVHNKLWKLRAEKVFPSNRLSEETNLKNAQQAHASRQSHLDALLLHRSVAQGPLDYQGRAGILFSMISRDVAALVARLRAIRTGILYIYGLSTPNIPPYKKLSSIHEIAIWLRSISERLYEIKAYESTGTVSMSLRNSISRAAWKSLLDGKTANFSFLNNNKSVIDDAFSIRFRGVYGEFIGRSDQVFDIDLRLPGKGRYNHTSRSSKLCDQSNLPPILLGRIPEMSSTLNSKFLNPETLNNASPLDNASHIDKKWKVKLHNRLKRDLDLEDIVFTFSLALLKPLGAHK